jgi:RHS repeat-associated protein
VVPASQGFSKSWTIHNSGTSTWNSGYSLQYSSNTGTAFCTHTTQTVSGSVAPGSNYTFSISCTAPSSSGTYQEYWRFAGPSGTINVSGSATIWVKIQVASTGPPAGTLRANPSTCQVATVNGNCAVSLVWTLQNTTSGEITFTDALGNNTVVGPLSGSSGSQPFTQIQGPPQKYTFYLWNFTGGSKGAQLASVPVAATGTNGASTPSVGVNPARNTPGSTFTIYGSGLAAGQATVYVQAPGIPGNSVGQISVGSDGGFNFPYTTQASSASGLYTAWAVDSSGKKSSSGTFTLYQPTPASIPTCQSNTTTSGCNGDPINTATGNYTYQRTDLAIPGRGLPFAFTRTYNSQDGTPGPMGAGWTHSYMASFVQNSDSSITIRTPDGQILMFDPVGGAYISRFNNVYSTLQSPSSGTFVLITKSQISYRFTGNQLSAISDRNGNTIQLTYSGANLTMITDTAGRQFSLQYNGSGHLTSLTDPLNRTLQYGYDGAGNLISFTDARSGQFTYTYDGSHEMLTAVDPVGNTFLTNTYDGSGHVSSQADGMGNRWIYSYDPNTLITTITDPSGKVSSHLHDSNFELLRATDTLGKNDQYQYDSLGNRISVQDRNGNATRLSYDTNGNVIAATDAQSNIQAAAYDAQSNPLTRTDALGNQATFTYDSKGNLATSVDPLGNKTVYAYNSYGQLASKTDALGRTTQYSYDTSGSLIQVIDPLGNKTAYAYDSVGRRTSTTDANGFTTATAYDMNDNIVIATDALGNKTVYGYDGNNSRTKVTDPRGKVTAYAYDGNQNLVTTTDALGNKITNTYDKLRNPASVTDQRGNTTRYGYDSENRLTGTTDPLGNTTSYAYDASGNRIKMTDPLGSVTAYGYDSLNRQTSITDALGNQSLSAYDAAGHVLKKTDPAGNVTTYSYDSTGRQTSNLDAAGGQVSFQYDKVGNRTQLTDARGKLTQFTYDGTNRLLTTTDPLGSSTKNQYDGVGNLVQVTDANGNSRAYQYDANRRQTKVTYSTGGSVQFTYDANGNRTKMVDLIGNSTYAYDDLNRLQNYTNPAGATLSLTYDAASNRTTIQYPGNKSVQYAYDANSRLSKVTDWNSLAASYSYDASGRMSGVTYSNGLTSQYTYDSIGQNLNTQHNNGGTALYSEATTWAPNGNPTSSNASGVTAPGLASENTIYAYNDANELTASTYGSPVSDKNGNLTIQPGFGGATVFTYDLNNRATSISGPNVSAVMKYFGDGKLAEMDSAGASHLYLTDPASTGNRILAELDATGAMQIGYVYGPRGMISQVLGGQTYSYLHNLQGSTIALVDASGSVQDAYRYDPFGRKLPSTTERVANSFAFLGRYSVPSVAQYAITTFRVYDSQQGRFTGLDPVRFNSGASASAFIYAGQSPLGRVDPTGLFSWQTFGSASWDLVKATGDTALGIGQSLIASAQFAACPAFAVVGGVMECVSGGSTTISALNTFNNAFANAGAAGQNIANAITNRAAVSPSSITTPFETIGNSVPGLNAAATVTNVLNDVYSLYDFFRLGGALSELSSLQTFQDLRGAITPSLILQNPTLLNALRALEAAKGASSILDALELPQTIQDLINTGASLSTGGSSAGNASGGKK